MREPAFNEMLQLGIVVRDLEATMGPAAEPGSAMTRMPRPTSVFRTTFEN
jgi:hypothetical protein